ncbi:PREDICTED: uncharacterized protein LOC106809823 [Priapulus caudatus]|uniref:Uncharacterized protein LOC106809823 n=1 Tax=Priapulus caudatus TaxID=37621 RepID=A0ABM1E8K5_PRICU|nr:PREDICTED: uncharacterized protein LOC106809823 [Priapulus caudatus]XP_014668523.1 PREDICTED: uncharacterized protein LOC106809823 [Priapulus caudatus]XP_014668524.1 PREDICTED: uncharacterized protein LOC106809823 [Priapulus caudatus]XP_014668525.1 PREDICTED: uncharacterized protein LOC106809823 [Priapulus caudatus]XP_014668526.1 PREDICTED: uncharacterized protein LOC106809823 [Priapulus caudatus]
MAAVLASIDVLPVAGLNVSNSTEQDFEYDDAVFRPHVHMADKLWAVGSLLLVCIVVLFAVSHSQMWKSRYYDVATPEGVFNPNEIVDTESVAVLIQKKLKYIRQFKQKWRNRRQAKMQDSRSADEIAVLLHSGMDDDDDDEEDELFSINLLKQL